MDGIVRLSSEERKALLQAYHGASVARRALVRDFGFYRTRWSCALLAMLL
jgi:hypothetical protein